MTLPLRSPAAHLRRLACALVAAGLAAAAPGAAAAAPAAPAAEEPCEPVQPCEIPLDEGPADAAAPADLAAEVKRLHAAAACAGGPLPAGLEQAAVAAFCARQGKALAAHRAAPLVASGFLAKLRPAGAPGAVVDPLGRDLLAALLAFPDARNVTTLSPEPAGPPRLFAPPGGPRASRADLRQLEAATARVLQPGGPGGPGARGGARSEGVLAEFVVALVAAGYEPVGLRYFRVAADGSLRYLSAAELAADPQAYASSELAFVKRGEDPSRPRYHRHVAAELSDAALARSPGVLAHLAAKGRFSVVTRGGGDRLWRADHGRARELLLRQVAFMISDAGGLPPAQARAAGLVHETHGAFAGGASPRETELAALWKGQPTRPLPARWTARGAGPDHLLVTRRP